MKKCKSLVAVALALAVCIGSFVGISPADITASAAEAQASENLIQNGGFEDEALGNWIIDNTNTNCAAVFTEQANSGTHSLKMATVKADGADSTVKQTIAVKERTNYSLSYYVYSEGDNWYDNGTGNKASQMKYSVMTTGDSPATIGTGTFQATGSNRWKFTLVTLTFNSGDNTSLDIVFDLANNGPYNSISGSGFSFFCIDDVSVTETGNLILNGSFDEGTFVKQVWNTSVGSFGPWKIHWDVAQDTAAGHADDGETDTNSITIREYGENTSNAMNYISQQFYVKQNTSYKLTFWAKSSTADVPYKAIISNQGETSATNSAIPSARITYKTRAIAAADTWEQFELEFNSGDNTVLYLYITGAYKDSNLYAALSVLFVS
jgi:carbohydrate binding domain